VRFRKNWLTIPLEIFHSASMALHFVKNVDTDDAA